MTHILTKLASSVIAIAMIASMAPTGVLAQAINTAPEATNQSINVDQDSSVSITLSGTDTEGDPLTFSLITGSAHGTTVVNPDGSATYVPNAAYTGADSFTFTANDGTVDSAPATVTITVNEVVPPGPTPETVTVTPDNTDGWSESSDTDGSAALVFSSDADSGDGALKLTTGSDRASVTHFSKDVSIPLSSLSSITYETDQISASDVENGNATLRISIDTDGDGILDDQLMYEPYYNDFDGTSMTGWQTWDIAKDNGKFWSNYEVAYNGLGAKGAGSYATNFMISDVLTGYPDAKIVGLVLSMGSGNPSQVVLVDNLHVVTNTEDTTYDFEPNPIPACSSDDSSFDTFTEGSVNGQNGWKATGPYDQEIVSNTYGFDDFGCKSLRVSDAKTSGSFDDWVFAQPLDNSVGEASSTNGGFDEGTKQGHFEMQFDIAAANPTAQPGSEVSVAPDRGDGSRMSYLRFEDSMAGINVFFDDVTDSGPLGTAATFNESQVASGLDRAVPHTIKLTLDAVDGPSNDVVKVFIDDALVATGTSWEDYYRYDPEAAAEQSPRIIKTMIIQARGTANPADDGYGFLFDNLSLTSSAISDSDEDDGDSHHHHHHHSSSNDSDDEDTDTTDTDSSDTETDATAPAGTTGGQVLGAATFNFTRDLYFGVVGEDVKELQTELIAAGFSIPDGPTTYFGPQTRAAVAAWQSANGVMPTAGYFGPISRAKYLANGGFSLAAVSPMADVPATTATTTSTTTATVGE